MSDCPISGPLPLRIAPFPDESLPGFTVRLAERNGFESVGWLLELAGIRAGRTMFFGRDLDRLSALSLVDRDTLASMGFEELADGRHCLLLGRSLRRSHVRIGNRHFCPACLVEAPYSRRCWDLSVVQICPTHLLRLVDRCDGCGKAISWLNPYIRRCRCGFDLACSQTRAVNPDQAAATGLLVGIADHGRTGDLAGPVARLTLSGLVDLLAVLGGGVAQMKRLMTVAVRGKRRPDYFQLLQDGLDCAMNWPVRFHEMLGSLREMASERRGSFGLQKSFGRLYVAIGLIQDDSAKRVVADAFRDFVRANGDIGLTRRRCGMLSRQDREQASHLTLKETSGQLGVSIAVVKRLVAGGVLEQSNVAGGRGKPQFIVSEAVRKLASRPGWLLNRTEAMSALGVDRPVFDKLVKRGLINPIHRGSGTSTPWLIDNDQVTGLLSSLERSCETPSRRRRTLPIRKASFFLFNARKGMVDLVSAIHEGRLQVAGIDETAVGLERLLIDESDLARIADEFRLGKPYLSAYQFAFQTDLHHDSIALLVETGLITGVERQDGPRAHYRISAEGLSTFNATYVSGPKLARELRLPWRSLRRFLSAASIEPIASPSCGNSRTLVFLRCERLSKLVDARAEAAKLRS